MKIGKRVTRQLDIGRKTGLGFALSVAVSVKCTLAINYSWNYR